MKARKLLVVGALCLACVGLAGCGKSVSADRLDAIEKSIAKDLTSSPNVNCPDDVDAKKGTSFDCTVSGGGTVKVTLNNDDATSYTYDGNVGGTKVTGFVG
jgi:hypothetical protein